MDDFIIENLGLGDENREVSYHHEEVGNIGGSHILENNDGECKTRIVKLDSYVRENKIPRVDFIKLDIEGSEMDMLKGATTSITRWKPKLAISAYHKMEDIFTLAKFLKSIRPVFCYNMQNIEHEKLKNKPAVQLFFS